MRHIRHSFLLLTALVLPVVAQVATDPIQDMEGVTFEQKLNSQVPMDLEFRDSEGRMVTLRDLAKDGKPLILSLVYYECPMLCNLVMNGMVSALSDVPYQINQDFQVVTLSFDPEETHVLAAEKKANYVSELDRPGAAEGWHFLVGEDLNIRQVAESVGFTYKWDEKTGRW